jgi:hypothetical protein
MPLSITLTSSPKLIGVRNRYISPRFPACPFCRDRDSKEGDLGIFASSFIDLMSGILPSCFSGFLLDAPFLELILVLGFAIIQSE